MKRVLNAGKSEIENPVQGMGQHYLVLYCLVANKKLTEVTGRKTPLWGYGLGAGGRRTEGGESKKGRETRKEEKKAGSTTP